MKNQEWVLIDTETTGMIAPVAVVELAAQRMRGWKPVGPPFRRLLNQSAEISPEASRVHGYTREILERDGEAPAQVYRDFASYVGARPLVAYNLRYDLDEVLKPDWQKFGIAAFGGGGFCALRLAQRLLDPVPAGNCKLQTLRQYYRLPERGAHTALGNVQTVADLLDAVLRPLTESRGLESWDELVSYARAEWYPSRIAFGRFKGRHLRDARTDRQLMDWLQWLAKSTNARTAAMGRWYLDHLESKPTPIQNVLAQAEDEPEDEGTRPRSGPRVAGGGVTLYENPQSEDLRRLIGAARTRLADLEATYTQERHALDVTRAALFGLLHKHYQTRDRLRLVVKFRKLYLETLLRGGEEEAEPLNERYQTESEESDRAYEEAASVASAQRPLSESEQAELKGLWRRLVQLYHPDRYVNDPTKYAAFQRLTSIINQARDEGGIDLLREIARDPSGFMAERGIGVLIFEDEKELESLSRLYESLQIKIVETLALLDELHEHRDYELHRLCIDNPGALRDLADALENEVQQEVAELETEAARLKEEIEGLTDRVVVGQ